MRRMNIFEGSLAHDEDDPPGYRSGYARVSDAIGEGGLAVKAFELHSGESVCPYHYEFVEEWLIVLSGRATIRHPEGEEIAEPGDAICFPAGPAGAHKVTNNESEPARLVMFSDAHEPSVAVYPDSDKIGVWPGRDEDHVMVPRAANVDYYEGER
jgi:uncharacterized cupin superfamily protein